MSPRGRIALLCAALLTGVAAGDDMAPKPAPQRVVHFYADDIEGPLLLLTAGELLVAQCKGKIRAQCTEAQRASASARPSIADQLKLMTLFRERVAVSLEKPVSSHEDMKTRLAGVAAELLIATDLYDRKLFARFGAVLQACPPPDAGEFRKSVSILVVDDLYRFAGASLEAFTQARLEIEAEEAALAQRIRKEWAMEDCKAALELGETLMQFMYTKVEPWFTDPELQMDGDERRGRDARFLFLAAYELESRVNPGLRGKFLELNRKNGIAESGLTN